MRRRFDPRRFPDRVIVLDATKSPPVELMNCLDCGRLTDDYFWSMNSCGECYRKWETRFREEWMRQRFGEKRAQ